MAEGVFDEVIEEDIDGLLLEERVGVALDVEDDVDVPETVGVADAVVVGLAVRVEVDEIAAVTEGVAPKLSLAVDVAV